MGGPSAESKGLQRCVNLTGYNMLTVTLGTFFTLFVLWVLSGYLPTRNIETPSYQVVKTKPDYEIRQYSSYILAETHQKGSGTGGFNELFQYISGNNIARSKVTMTAPVLQSAPTDGQKIPMSAPVIKDSASSIAFVMPAGSKLADLPQPKSSNIELRVVPPQTVAVIAFSGYATEDKIKEKSAKLLSALERDHIHVLSAPQIALYNPPWTPPFMRRNEAMVEIHLVE